MSSEEIAFVLDTEDIYQNLWSSYILWIWGVNVLFVIVIVLFSLYYLENFNSAVANVLGDQTEVVITVLTIGMLLILAEIVATVVRLVDDSGTDYLQTKMVFYYVSYHIIILILMIIGFFFLLIIILGWKIKRSIVIFQNCKLLVYISSGFFIAHICYYALPTFFFLLVYPTKVIVVAMYFISYIFFYNSIFCSVHRCLQNSHKA